MRRAFRPVPIEVPQADTPSDFKLSDSGVFEQGGLVVSKAGCIINRNSDVSSQASSRPGSCCKDPASASSSRPASRTSSTPGTAAAAHYAQATLAAAAAAATAAAVSAAAPGSCSAASTPSESSSSGNIASSGQAAVALDDLQELAVIGSGSSGVVKKVLHKPSGAVYVLKVINFDMGSEQVRRQVTTEVKALDGARHPHIVAYHQSYFANGAITILMEFMDGGSLWDVLQKVRVIPEAYLPELVRQVLLGLSHLHGSARICHRDIKPSNLLLSSSGQLKISDFGVSSQLSNSMSKCLSWVGTVTYMSPERIRGDSYTFNTDVWSLGLLVLECAVGRYPYPPVPEGPGAGSGGEGVGAHGGARLGFWELLEYIVVEPAPKLPAGQFSLELVDFVGQCLQKDPAKRPSAADMLQHPFITKGSRANLSDLLKPLHNRPSSSRSRPGSSGARPGSSSSSRAGCSSGAALGSVAAKAAGQRAAAPGSLGLRHSAFGGQPSPYLTSCQPRPVSGGTAGAVKVCGTQKQEQQQQTRKLVQQQQQQQVARHLGQQQVVQQVVQQQRPLSGQQAGQALGQQPQQQLGQHLGQQQPLQQLQQQRPVIRQPVQQRQRPLRQTAQHQPMQQQQRHVLQPPAASSGPLTALKPTPRRPPDVPAT